MKSIRNVIKAPIVTERTTALRDLYNQFVFDVEVGATKKVIKEAVERAFKVKVVSVNTLIVRGKVKRVGRFEGKKSNHKKAFVTLRAGDKIEVMEGV